MKITLQGVSKSFSSLEVCKDFYLELQEDQIHCFFGPSGCGKTTLLQMIGGIWPADQGAILGVDGRRISYVFQEERLLPWLNVEQNIHFVLKSHFDHKEIMHRTKEAIDLVELTEFRKYYPHELSGGMKQRVSLARAFAFGGDLILMDEPFKGLHRGLKFALMDFIKVYSKKQHPTILFVTHDYEEAEYLADRLYYLEGPPLKILRIEGDKEKHRVD